MKLIVRVVALPSPQAYGDWHDKPVCWQVVGPALEVQKFSTKKDALKYASLRRRAETQRIAINRYVMS